MVGNGVSFVDLLSSLQGFLDVGRSFWLRKRMEVSGLRGSKKRSQVSLEVSNSCHAYRT